MSTQPTDDDLTACYREANGENTGKAQPLTTARILKAMRAAIAKWGTPATGGEPVAAVEVRPSKHGTTLTWSPDLGAFSLPNGMHRLYTSPQPVREPLTDGQAREVLWTEHLRWMGAAGLDTEGMRPTGEWLDHFLTYARAIEAAHGITGGQT